jgi:hypothetical protein
MNMKPLKIALPPDLRDRLERSAAKHGRSIGEEVRVRVETTFALERIDFQTQGFMDLIWLLSLLIRPQTGHSWHEHAGAHHVFQQAVALLLARLKPAGDPVLDPAALPSDRPVAVVDLEAMSAGLEAIISSGRLLQPSEQAALRKRFETPPPPARSRLRKPKEK